jgi:hypothetical protein
MHSWNALFSTHHRALVAIALLLAVCPAALAAPPFAPGKCNHAWGIHVPKELRSKRTVTVQVRYSVSGPLRHILEHTFGELYVVYRHKVPPGVNVIGIFGTGVRFTHLSRLPSGQRSRR